MPQRLAIPIGLLMLCVHAVAQQPVQTSSSLRRYDLPGLPDREYSFDIKFEHGTLEVLELSGTLGYLMTPRGEIDPARRWVWISPMYLALHSAEQRRVAHKYYVEELLAKGFHVAGIDIGVSAGSPAGAAIYHRLYETLTGPEHRLNRRARCIAQSNGGLRVYAWAFRHPRCVDRIFGIFPVTDMRDWPGLDRVIGPQSIVPAGVAYPLTRAELEARLSEFNPIDNLKPLAEAGVKIYHIHGDADKLVRPGPNSIEFGRRYAALGGAFRLDLLPGVGHDGTGPNHRREQALEFLTGK